MFSEEMTADIKEWNHFLMKMFSSQIEFSIYKRGPQQNENKSLKEKRKIVVKNPFDKNHYKHNCKLILEELSAFLIFFGLLEKKKNIPKAEVRFE